MKVTFLFSGLPHYLIALFNRLVEQHGVDVSLIVPRERGMSLGEGIRLGDADRDYRFSIHYLEEFRGRLNKPYFMDLHTKLDLFRRLDAVCKPGAVLATTTSSLPVVEMAAATSRAP